ncbi:MAG TPA: hypothetical protein VLA77_00640 [Candidatus Saccharimonadales bacterium]|nr:hypothetical protein [Candidatus Saccharimonadales bacterium]
MSPERSENQEVFTGIDFFATGFTEIAQQPHLGKNASGPHTEVIRSVLNKIQEELTQIDDRLDPGFLTSQDYFTPDMRALSDTLALHKRAQTSDLAGHKDTSLAHVFNEAIWPDLQNQHIDSHLLAEPPFATMRGLNMLYDGIVGIRSCANACFRMVFAGVTGTMPAARSVAYGATQVFGDPVIENHQYLNFFHSTAFKKFYKKRVATVDILGSDFSTIANLAQIANKHAAKLFCILPLKSTNSSLAKHQVILTGVAQDEVMFTDPLSGHKNFAPKQQFAERWAQALNQALIVIAF